jgi:hypothetical protein
MVCVLLALLFSVTHAAPCEEAWTVEDLRDLADRADRALDTDDMVTHAKTFRELRESAECIREPVSAEEWARMLVSLALVEHALERDWRSPLTAALTAFPGVDHQTGPDDIRQFPLPVADETHYVPVAGDGIFFLDGRQVTAVPPGDLTGPHLVQSYAEGTWETRYLEDAPYPSNWLAPSSAEGTATVSKRPPMLLIGGAGAATVGVATAAGSYFSARGRDSVTEEGEAALKAVNYSGWALAGAGAGLVTVHFVTGATVSAGPGGLAVGGRF